MNPREPQTVPAQTQRASLILSLVAAHSAIIREMESRAKMTLTRGQVLAAFRGGAVLNQNQVAKHLGMDRTVVHRTIRSLVEEGYLLEAPAEKGRSLLLKLTAKGEGFRETMIRERKHLDASFSELLGPAVADTLRQGLQAITAQVQVGAGKTRTE